MFDLKCLDTELFAARDFWFHAGIWRYMPHWAIHTGFQKLMMKMNGVYPQISFITESCVGHFSKSSVVYSLRDCALGVRFRVQTALSRGRIGKSSFPHSRVWPPAKFSRRKLPVWPALCIRSWHMLANRNRIWLRWRASCNPSQWHRPSWQTLRSFAEWDGGHFPVG